MRRTGWLLEIGAMLPAVTLPGVGEGRSLRLRWAPNGATVLVLPHPGRCEDCLAYHELLVTHADDYARWDGQAVAVLADGAAPPPAGLRAVRDEGRRLREACGIGDDAAVLIADRYGQVHRSAVAGDDHALPDPATDVLDELCNLGIKCPECDQWDGALGPWAQASGAQAGG